MELSIAAAVFALVFVGTLALMNRRIGKPMAAEELLRRIRPISDPLDVDLTRKQKPREGKLGHALLQRVNLLRRLEQYMWQAGLYWRVSEIVLAELLLLALGMFVGMTALDDLLLATGCGAALSTLPLLYVGFRRKRRLKAFARQLPHALDMVKSTMEAGHSLARAFHVVVGEFSDPISGEIRTVLEQARLGVPLVRALDDLLKRVPHEDLRLMVSAIKMQTEVGSSLAHIVGRLSEVIRTRQRLHQQIRALTAQARMGGMVVGFLPAVVLVIFSVIQPSFTHMLFHDPVGIHLLKLAMGLDVMALVTIRKVVKVKY
ncbi:MAG: type II secretion system F family protein [Candidatus Binataceae bacterium]